MAPALPPPSMAGPDAYDSSGSYDEAYDDRGGVRPAYTSVMARLAETDLDAVCVAVNGLLADRGVHFGGQDGGHSFRADPVPRLLTRQEWVTLSAGLRQRVRTLDAFLADVYGEQRAVEAGVVPARIVAGAGYFERDLVGVTPPGAFWLGIAGLDVVRDAGGVFHVLEDNARTPSGVAYAAAVSVAVGEVLGVETPASGLENEVGPALRATLEASAPGVEGELVLLSDGPANSAWWEHEWLAGLAGLRLVLVEDLRRRDGRVQLTDGTRVRAVYRRTSEDQVRDPSGRLTRTADLLLEPLRAGTVGMVNLFGTGVADDKSVYAYLDELTRFFLGEEPSVPSVPTYDLLEAPRREEVLDRLPDLVVKPRDGAGGDGVVIGPRATAAELDAARRSVREDPGGWIAQDLLQLSTHPTVVDGRLAPRRVDLRPFAFHDGREVVVPLGGLTRVALAEGSMVVNSSRAGGGKATWVVD